MEQVDSSNRQVRTGLSSEPMENGGENPPDRTLTLERSALRGTGKQLERIETNGDTIYVHVIR